MTYALFLGCTIPARSRNYELSARKVAQRLGIELVDMDTFVCCGFPLKSADLDAAELLGAYNLGLAKEKGLDICALCSSCTSALAEVAHRLAGDDTQTSRINDRLSKVGISYTGGVKVRHFARVLFEEIGADRIRPHIQKDLSDLKIAIHYGCHYLKPSNVHEHFDDVEDPHSIDALVALTGARVVDYAEKRKCCGGPLLPVDEKLATRVTKEKLDAVKEAGADAICLVCPFCSVMYDGNQKSIESEYDIDYGLPVLYLTQLLGVAMGFERKELGLNMNVVKTKSLLKPYFD
ncbi:MAG: CoB--CoM heterodisulfide reductase iron-sulfur subunit B family protein [Deltaproteobacteria bacterium]|jgi:heterodisulfide reductase subunit B